MQCATKVKICAPNASRQRIAPGAEVQAKQELLLLRRCRILVRDAEMVAHAANEAVKKCQIGSN